MPLPSGFVVPPLPHLVLLLVSAAAVIAAMYLRRPRIDDRAILALVPWMVAGGGLRVAERVGALAPEVAPLATAPAVYATMAVVAGAVWAAVPRRPRAFAAGGAGFATVVIVMALLAAPTLTLWPLVALPVTLVVGGGPLLAYRRLYPRSAHAVAPLSAVVLFSHALDGVTTAIGMDLLDVHEQTPLPRLILDFAAGLPTAEVIGAGWLFVLVKLAVALVVVHISVPYVRDEPLQGRLLLLIVAAVGLGPGVHNLLLFVVGG